MAPAFHLVSEEPTPRFLGLTVAERNARIARRAGVLAEVEERIDFPTLTVPAGVVITPQLITALPPPSGCRHLHWSLVRPAMVWCAAGVAGVRATAASQLPKDAALDVSTARARCYATWRLLRGSGKTTDRWLAKNFDRRFSQPLSFVFVHLGLTPNGATFITLLIGLTSAGLMAQTSHASMIAGAFLFWFASIFDGVDGEIARIKLTDSAWGEKFDTAVDQATYLAVFGGIMIGAWRQGIGSLQWAFAIGVAVAAPLLLLGLRGLERTARAGQGDVFVDKPVEVGIERAAAATGALALKLAMFTFTLFRRESFSLAFIPISLITGQRAVFVGVVGGAIFYVAITLLAYRGAIERAMRAMYAQAT